MTQKKGNKPFQLNSLDLSNIIEYPFVRSILPIRNTVDLHVISIKSKDIFNTGKKRSFSIIIILSLVILLMLTVRVKSGAAMMITFFLPEYLIVTPEERTYIEYCQRT